VKAEPGWDGSYGPFFQARDGKPGVNHASISHTDYITAALEGRFGRALFENLTSDVLIERMTCHRRCIQALGKLTSSTEQVNQTDFWLISAEQKDWELEPGSELKGRGYLFEYALSVGGFPDAVEGEYDRSWQAIKPTIYVCGVTADGVVRYETKTLLA
jgi:hypothetical protein